ncbi:MAG: NAD(P)/FAD-dependent oxidoreductase [Desulfatitalea sp.]|nr:NAD(P)/FAD-dependent oxidoreductase [Desulfatitalea sp.]NNK00811.1 NAD(P)/FAD-dependent oxidoreductase [Desulfatitalea sp.]
MAKHDVIIVGAGQNGLSLGAYLVKAGLDVLVLEMQDFIGGSCSTKELTLPGFKHDCCAALHAYIRANPLVKHDELGIVSKYGLDYIHPEGAFSHAFEDETGFVVYADLDKCCQSMAKISEKDAETYRAMVLKLQPIVAMLMNTMFNPPIPQGALLNMLDQSPEGQEIMRFMGMSAYQIINRNFESEKIKTALTKMVTEPICAPEDLGTGIHFALLLPFAHSIPYTILKGGSGEFSNALARYIEDNGGTVRTGCEVKKIIVSGGKAKGVVLAGGEEIFAHRAVVTNLDPRLVFPRMVSEVSDDLITKVGNIDDAPFTGMVIHLALNEAPKWKAGEEISLAGAQEPLRGLEHVRREFDDFRYGLPAADDHICPMVVCHSNFDPTRAPNGKHTLWLFQYQPYALADGGADRWDEIKDREGEKVVKRLQKYCANMGPENILATTVKSPRDYERWNVNLVHGNVCGPLQTFYQLFSHRPIPALGDYRTPIEGLYGCGHAYHPAGGISGGGRAVSQVLMQDFGIDFENILG